MFEPLNIQISQDMLQIEVSRSAALQVSRSAALHEMRYAAMKAAAERGVADGKAASESRIAWELAHSHLAATKLQTQTREQLEPDVQNITTKLAGSKVVAMP